jgi:iron(III) transport system substrate-binding protein
VALLVAAVLAIPAFLALRDSDAVVVYTSQDQVYSEPILRDFQESTGLRTRVVYDSEAVKTVGLANRLIAERHHPQCDIFWSNEELRTRQLAAAGIFDSEEPWRAVGYRSRRIVINTNFLSMTSAPATLQELTDPKWRGKVALAYPLFGTTATHFLALRQHWGPAAWEEWCRALQANQPLMVDGNSRVVNLVGRGEAWIGLTDSDDIAAGQRNGLPVAPLPITSEMLLIPNTVALIRGAPRPEAGRILFEHLQSPAVLDRLIAAHALEGRSPEALAQSTLQPDWNSILADLEAATAELSRIFLR